MNKLEDIKLKKILREIKLDSPKADFSDRVMNRILQEENSLEKIKSQRIFGKTFWIILALFVVVYVAIITLLNVGLSGESQMIDLLPNFYTNAVSTSYQSIFQTIETLPLSIAGAFMAISILIFMDYFVKSKLVNHHFHQ